MRTNVNYKTLQRINKTLHFINNILLVSLEHQGKQLKLAIKKHKLTATEIAQKIGISRNYLYDLFKEETINDIARKAIGARQPQNELVFNLPGSWFGNVKVIRKWCKRAGIHRNITWHSARHSFATLMIQISDFRTTAEFMGQSDPRSTMRYLHANNQQKVAAVSLLPGNGKEK